MYKKLKKNVCCTLDLTIGARIISSVGIIISLLLITMLLNDKYVDMQENNFDKSRKTALAFGLDWQHIHPNASTTHENDPEGMKISILVIFYSIAFLLLNLLLFFATIVNDWKYTIPWLIGELLGCISKFGALIYHLSYESDELSLIFIVGSIIYIVVMMWWWVVVFLAQLSWRKMTNPEVKLELTNISASSGENVEFIPGRIRYFPGTDKNDDTMDSPGPYIANNMYSII